MRRFLSWDPKFTQRNAELYDAENLRLHVPPGLTRIEAFLSLRVHRLMPEQYSYAALREFLERDLLDVGRLEETVPIRDGSQAAEKIVLLDERRDPSRPNTSSSRYWAEYAQYPPLGESVCLKALSTKGLYDILKTGVRAVRAGPFGYPNTDGFSERASVQVHRSVGACKQPPMGCVQSTKAYKIYQRSVASMCACSCPPSLHSVCAFTSGFPIEIYHSQSFLWNLHCRSSYHTRQ
jgi:hypothetical protein